MASSALLPLLLLSFLVAAAYGRPCKTLFYFSATTYYPSNSLDRNPPRFITLIFTTTSNPRFPHPQLNENPQSSSSDFPLNFHSVSSPVRDRTMDILSVAGALLFGVGCGAITAAVMYSLWALFSSCCVDYDEADDDVIVAKKLGYVSIPAQAKMVDDDIKKPAPPAKEVV